MCSFGELVHLVSTELLNLVNTELVHRFDTELLLFWPAAL